MESKLNKSGFGCDDVEQRIDQLLDDRLTLDGDPVLMEHAAQCAECRQLIDDYDAVELSWGKHRENFLNEPSMVEPAINDQNFLFERRRLFGLILTLAASLLLVVSIVSNQDFQERPTARISRPTVQVATSSLKSPSAALSSPSAAPDSLAVNLGHSTSTKNSTLASSSVAPYVPTKVNYSDGVDQPTNFVRNLVFSQRMSLYEIAQSTPEFVSSVRSTTTSWGRLSDHLDPLNPILIYSSELPGICNVQYSVSMTIELLQRSISNRDQPKPNLGSFPDVQQIIKSYA